MESLSERANSGRKIRKGGLGISHKSGEKLKINTVLTQQEPSGFVGTGVLEWRALLIQLKKSALAS